ncbi:hypothetical protein KM043_009486 [Ampulex compressa]|nr:hypothetical protein KM043_009486 [Ampulex compressa]
MSGRKKGSGGGGGPYRCGERSSEKAVACRNCLCGREGLLFTAGRRRKGESERRRAVQGRGPADSSEERREWEKDGDMMTPGESLIDMGVVFVGDMATVKTLSM